MQFRVQQIELAGVFTPALLVGLYLEAATLPDAEPSSSPPESLSCVTRTTTSTITPMATMFKTTTGMMYREYHLKSSEHKDGYWHW